MKSSESAGIKYYCSELSQSTQSTGLAKESKSAYSSDNFPLMLFVVLIPTTKIWIYSMYISMDEWIKKL
jgi:hypothetical protein